MIRTIIVYLAIFLACVSGENAESQWFQDGSGEWLLYEIGDNGSGSVKDVEGNIVDNPGRDVSIENVVKRHNGNLGTVSHEIQLPTIPEVSEHEAEAGTKTQE